MTHILKKIKSTNHSFIRWGLVGTLTTILDYILFLIFFKFLNSVFIANLFSGIIATSINYKSHHKWTFKSSSKHSNSGIRYVANLIFWWLVSTSIIKILILAGIDPKLAKLIPLFIIVPINYFILNIFVFKNSLKIFQFKKNIK